MNKSNNNVSSLDSIIETAKEAKEFLAEIGDTGVDAVTDIEILEKIPFISWVIKAYKLKETFQLKRLQKNTKAFLQAVSKSNKKVIIEFATRLKDDPVFAEEFSDTILSILIESNKPIKANIVGSLVIALARERIDKQDFENMSLIVQSTSVPALRALQDYFKRTRGASYASNARCHEEPLLLSLGVVSRHGNNFLISTLGRKLFYYGFKELLSDENGLLSDEWQRCFEGFHKGDTGNHYY